MNDPKMIEKARRELVSQYSEWLDSQGLILEEKASQGPLAAMTEPTSHYSIRIGCSIWILRIALAASLVTLAILDLTGVL